MDTLPIPIEFIDQVHVMADNSTKRIKGWYSWTTQAPTRNTLNLKRIRKKSGRCRLLYSS